MTPAPTITPPRANPAIAPSIPDDPAAASAAAATAGEEYASAPSPAAAAAAATFDDRLTRTSSAQATVRDFLFLEVR